MNHLKIYKGLKVKLRPLKNIRRSYIQRGMLWDYMEYRDGGEHRKDYIGKEGVIVRDVYDTWDNVYVKFKGIKQKVYLEYFEVMPHVKTLDLKGIYNEN